MNDYKFIQEKMQSSPNVKITQEEIQKFPNLLYNTLGLK